MRTCNLNANNKLFCTHVMHRALWQNGRNEMLMSSGPMCECVLTIANAIANDTNSTQYTRMLVAIY